MKAGMTGIFSLTGSLSLFGIYIVKKLARCAAGAASAGWGEVLRGLARQGAAAPELRCVQPAFRADGDVVAVGAGRAGRTAGRRALENVPAGRAAVVRFHGAEIIAAEKRGRMKFAFTAAIVLLLAVQAGFGWFGDCIHAVRLVAAVVAFNILEAVQPSLISRLAPKHAKGAALGIYNTTQSLGLFLGGVTGGWLAGAAGQPSGACVVYPCWLGWRSERRWRSRHAGLSSRPNLFIIAAFRTRLFREFSWPRSTKSFSSATSVPTRKPLHAER